MMTHFAPRCLLATALAALLAAAGSVAEAAEPKRPERQDERAKRSQGMDNPTARQGTPVLRVVAGKPLQAEAAEVVRVWPGSPAEQAGLKAGDRVVKVGEEEVNSPEALRMEVLKYEPGDRVKLEVKLPTTGVAELAPTKGNQASGTILLEQKEDGLHLTGEVRGLKPGLHGFHIHEYGDLRDPKAQSAGGHFNPRGTRHGGPEDEEHHAGDLGNVRANQDGVAQVDIVAPWLGLHYVAGRSIVVHQSEDDLTSQPFGDAGTRVAAGVIGITDSKKSTEITRAND